MISENAEFWIWITNALGYNTPKVKRINELYTDISQFYEGGEKEWRYSGILSANDIIKLRETDIRSSKRIIDRCNQLNYSIICIDDRSYPNCLKNIYSPPAVLYVSGKLPDVDNRLVIGIVGTRSASEYGVKNSYQFAYALSKCGVATVSGGALGIDCASHRGALAADGVTICVRGCGINYNYLHENERMRNAITKKGAVISEYPPDEAPRNYYFPARNRIIAALSQGILIIESGEKSGSLITANLALEMGKEVFALMGNNTPQNRGSNHRIKEGSATPVTDFMDILYAFDNLYITGEDVDFDSISLADIEAVPVKGRAKVSQQKSQQKLPKRQSKDVQSKSTDNTLDNTDKENKPIHKENLNLEGDIRKIYEYLSDKPVHIDKIASDLQIPVFKVLSSLSYLEINDLATALQGRNFILK